MTNFNLGRTDDFAIQTVTLLHHFEHCIIILLLARVNSHHGVMLERIKLLP